MYNTLKCLLLSASITLFAQVPGLFDWEVEKLGFGALLFFIIWTYMKNVLPKTQEDMERKNNRIAELIAEVGRLNAMREKDQHTIVNLLKETGQNPRDKTQNDENDEG